MSPEPEGQIIKVRTKNFWNRNPDHDEIVVVDVSNLPKGPPNPINRTGEETDVEGSEVENKGSPQFPVVDPKKMERNFDAAGEPTKGAK